MPARYSRNIVFTEHHDAIIEDLSKARNISASEVVRQFIDRALDLSPEAQLTKLQDETAEHEEAIERNRERIRDIEKTIAERGPPPETSKQAAAPRPAPKFTDLRDTNGSERNKDSVMRLLPDIANRNGVSDKAKAWVREHLEAHPEWISCVAPDRRKVLLTELGMHDTGSPEIDMQRGAMAPAIEGEAEHHA